VLRRIGEANKRSVEEVALRSDPDPNPNPNPNPKPHPNPNPNPNPNQVALRWVVQGGCAVSVRPTADFGMGNSK